MCQKKLICVIIHFMLNALHMQYNTIIERGAHKMGLMTFKGGVHPFEGKDLSKDKPIRE